MQGVINGITTGRILLWKNCTKGESVVAIIDFSRVKELQQIDKEIDELEGREKKGQRRLISTALHRLKEIHEALNGHPPEFPFEEPRRVIGEQ